MQTEFVRSLNCNYERILLDQKPEDKKYQYCILNRGGIRGLLPCSLRYINGVGYLYYDISSRQNMIQRYGSKNITREWFRDFIWSYRQIRLEMERFLLDIQNILWYPEQIFQDIESNEFSFLYIPYYDGDSGFQKLMDFWVDRIDYEDEVLVECVYRMYEQFEQEGDVYLQSKILDDVRILETGPQTDKKKGEEESTLCETTQTDESLSVQREERTSDNNKGSSDQKRGILSIFENRKRKNRELRENYQQNMQDIMHEYSVAEDTVYEEYGKTIYVESIQQEDRKRELRTSTGKILAVIENNTVTIGKKKGESDIILEDASVSRMHARVIREEDHYYIEDLNSTNGTYKNGLALQPYEKRRLEEGDELKIGRVLLTFV